MNFDIVRITFLLLVTIVAVAASILASVYDYIKAVPEEQAGDSRPNPIRSTIIRSYAWRTAARNSS